MQRLVTTILLIIVITPLMQGCGHSWQDDYNKEYYTLSKVAINNCQQYGQTYEFHYYDVNNTRWEVICSQDNPYKIITKEIKEMIQ